MTDPSMPFQAIYTTYRPRILRYLTRLVGQSEAEDLTQHVLVKVSEGLPQFRGDSNLSTWIYRIATNTALDELRSPHWKQTQGAACGGAMADNDPDLDEEGTFVEEPAGSVEQDVIHGEMNQCIRDFVEHLPENYRTVMVLSELEGFTNSEIGDILGVSLPTVKIRLHRAREKLRQDLSVGCSFHHDERSEFACDRKA
jgi:RNA polymerase sigma-70 factor (ECF subfamily)